MGKGCLPDSHPLNYGPPGMHGSKYANWALNKSDLVIAIGTRFDDRVTGKVSAFAPGAKVDPLRHRRGRGREDPRRGDPGGRPAEARAGASSSRELRSARQERAPEARGVAAPARGVAREASRTATRRSTVS